MMRHRIDAILPKSAFVRSIGVLTSGTVVAQAVMALALPLLTRMYTPANFNLLAVYASVLGLVTVASCLRFNIAVPIPESDSDGMNLLVLSLAGGAGVAALASLPIIAMPHATAALLGQPGIVPYLWMIPVGVLCASCYDALQYWASRKKRFGLVTRTRMTRAVGGAGCQLACGAVSPSPFGLMLGHLVYTGLGVLGLARSVWKDDRKFLEAVSPASLWRTAKAYRRFPLYSVPEALFNTAGLEVSILIIAATALGPEAGFLMLAMRVLGLPMGLVGTSIAQVYLTEAGGRFRDGDLAAFTRRMMWTLFKTGAPVLFVAAIACPLLFPLIFGAGWARAGWIVAWLSPMFLLQFVASPVSMVLHVIGKLASAMWLQIAGGVFRVGAVLAVAQIAPDKVTEGFATSGAIFYMCMIALVYIHIRRLDRACP